MANNIPVLSAGWQPLACLRAIVIPPCAASCNSAAPRAHCPLAAIVRQRAAATLALANPRGRVTTPRGCRLGTSRPSIQSKGRSALRDLWDRTPYATGRSWPVARTCRSRRRGTSGVGAEERRFGQVRCGPVYERLPGFPLHRDAQRPARRAMQLAVSSGSRTNALFMARSFALYPGRLNTVLVRGRPVSLPAGRKAYVPTIPPTRCRRSRR